VPLIRVEIREGWSRVDKSRLLDAIHAAVAEALKIPDEGRTQILTEHYVGQIGARALPSGSDQAGRAAMLRRWPRSAPQRIDRCCP
jgi:hypothetical protein